MIDRPKFDETYIVDQSVKITEPNKYSLLTCIRPAYDFECVNMNIFRGVLMYTD